LSSTGSQYEYGALYTSAHLGHVEQMHRTLQGKAQTMHLASKCSESLWDEFYLTATHLHVKTPTKSLGEKTPFQLWHKHIPDYSYM
ncbi:Copia protein, partial [Termitomyces sp. J132]